MQNSTGRFLALHMSYSISLNLLAERAGQRRRKHGAEKLIGEMFGRMREKVFVSTFRITEWRSSEKEETLMES